MKHTTILLLLAAMQFSARAQTPFEGTITYAVAESKQADSMRVVVSFGVNKLKVQLHSRFSRENADYTVVNFDSGKVFVVRPDSKTYSSRRLVMRPAQTEVPPTKMIAGHPTVGTRNTDAVVGGMVGGLSANSIFYISEDLFYPIPEKWDTHANMELMMIQNGRIILGAELYGPRLGSFVKEEEDDSATVAKSEATIEAISVVAEKLPEERFAIPSGFTKQAKRWETTADTTWTTMNDSTYIETTTVTPVPYDAKAKGKRSSPKKKGITKSPANRRKQQ